MEIIELRINIYWKKIQEQAPKKVYAQTKDGRQEQIKQKVTIDLEEEVISVEEKNAEDQNAENEEEIAKQKYATKGKAPEINLCPDAVLRAQDLQLEDELNDVVENARTDPNRLENDADESSSDSQGSFVDATQYQ